MTTNGKFIFLSILSIVTSAILYFAKSYFTINNTILNDNWLFALSILFGAVVLILSVLTNQARMQVTTFNYKNLIYFFVLIISVISVIK